MKLQDMDLVYPFLLPSDGGEELRHSLRSVCDNLPHRNVYIIGENMPEWITGVKQIRVKDDGTTRYNNTGCKLAMTCESDELSDEFILMNDDFFVLHKMENIPHYVWGTIEQHIEELHQRNGYISDYTKLLRDTQEWLTKRGLPTMDFTIHAPMIINKEKMRVTATQGLSARCIYGNLHGVRPLKVHDFKIYTLDELWGVTWPFVSSNNASWHDGRVGHELRRRFSIPCKYEKEET